nr:MAG TPA: protein of unknown function (DUF2179) [Caudoviricetes sp.]
MLYCICSQVEKRNFQEIKKRLDKNQKVCYTVFRS